MNILFLGMHTRNLGAKSRAVTNPFTGTSVAAYIDDGMTGAEAQASEIIMGEAHASERDPDGFRMVKFPGGNYVHINHGTCGAEIHVTGGLTTDVAEFIFRLGLASGMLVTSTIDPNIAAVLPGQSHFCITGRWPDAAHVGSVRDLMNWVGRMVAEDRLASE